MKFRKFYTVYKPPRTLVSTLSHTKFTSLRKYQTHYKLFSKSFFAKRNGFGMQGWDKHGRKSVMSSKEPRHFFRSSFPTFSFSFASCFLTSIFSSEILFSWTDLEIRRFLLHSRLRRILKKKLDKLERTVCE